MTSRAGTTILERILDGREPLLDLMSEYRAAIEKEVRDDIRAKLTSAALMMSWSKDTLAALVSIVDDPRPAGPIAISSSSATETQDGERWLDVGTPRARRAAPRRSTQDGERHDEWVARLDAEERASLRSPTPDDRETGHRGWPTECAVEGCWLASGHDGDHAPDAVSPDDRDREVERIARALPGEVQPFTTESGLTLDGMLLVGNRESIAATIVENLRRDAGLRASGGNER